MIGNFGTSRLVDTNASQTKQAGTPLYMAPEMYEDPGHTIVVDIYSLGLIIYEVLVAAPEFLPSLTPLAIMNKAATGQHPEIPDTMNPTVRQIIESCWGTEPGRQPPVT
jgi:serine/threonine protein kinase